MSDSALREWTAAEQATLWHDLYQDLDRAINGSWSMAAADTARRIVGAARLVGATSYDECPWPLVVGGVYEAILRAGDITPTLPDDGEMARLGERMANHVGRPDAIRRRMSATVTAIESERETAYIRDYEGSEK